MRRHVWIVAVLAVALAGSARAFEVRQTFRPERFTRGNTNIRVLQPIDTASWIWLRGAEIVEGERFPFVRFRTTFKSDGSPLVFDVSADPRFVLLLDGQEISRGPHVGFVEHWYYQTYEVTGLAKGPHMLEAVVFYLGRHGPLALLSSLRAGFVLKAEGSYDASLTTGKADWRAARIPCMDFSAKATDPDTMTGHENIVRGTGFLDWKDLDWKKPAVTARPITDGEYGGRRRQPQLFPTERPDQLHATKTPGRVCAVQMKFDGVDSPYVEADRVNPWTAKFDTLLKRGAPVTVPPRTELRLLWDYGNYYCAFPLLETKGGRGATIRWAWTEGLYNAKIDRFLYECKGNRSAFIGKRVYRSMYDTFLPDGRDASFTVPWWKAGRWGEIAVKTGDEPLVLTRLALTETRYPLEVRSSFACDDPSVSDISRLCVRTMENSLHEMFMDCPYFEQQMYPGDTRLEMLTLNTLAYDDRPLRFGIGIFDYARRNDGTVPMNFPTVNCQESSTYSTCWAMMCGDYALWHGTNEFLRARLPGLRHTLFALDHYRNADGLLEGLPGWSFMDWVPEWGFFGNAPDGRDGLSALNNLQYMLALRSAIRVETAFGNAEMAAYWRGRADALARALTAAFWNGERGLLADTAKKDVFSEHAQCLALLADVLPPDKARRALTGLCSEPDLVRTTVYFSHYLFETYLRFGRTDLFLRRLDLWRGFLAEGQSTLPEAPGPRARSDCHAWGAHPLYHLQTGVAGIRPASSGFASVKIAPNPGPLSFVRSTMPTPKGPVSVDLRFKGDTVSGTVTIPKGLPGVFEWKGEVKALKEGRNAL